MYIAMTKCCCIWVTYLNTLTLLKFVQVIRPYTDINDMNTVGVEFIFKVLSYS